MGRVVGLVDRTASAPALSNPLAVSACVSARIYAFLDAARSAPRSLSRWISRRTPPVVDERSITSSRCAVGGNTSVCSPVR